MIMILHLGELCVFGALKFFFFFNLIFDFVCVCQWFVGVFVGMKSCYKLIVVDVAVAVSVEDVCDGAHLQTTSGEF